MKSITLEIDHDDHGKPVIAWQCGEHGAYSNTIEGAVDDATVVTGMRFPRRCAFDKAPIPSCLNTQTR